MKSTIRYDCEKYVDRRLGGWDNVHLKAESVNRIAGWKMTIECADDAQVILRDSSNRLWLLQYYVSCTYSDCSDADDPYGGLELYRIFLKHPPRFGATKSWEKRFAPKKRGDK